jgi:hypothetical protein
MIDICQQSWEKYGGSMVVIILTEISMAQIHLGFS